MDLLLRPQTLFLSSGCLEALVSRTTSPDKSDTNLNRFDIRVKECLELLKEAIGCGLHQITFGLTQFLLRLTAFHQRAAYDADTRHRQKYVTCNNVCKLCQTSCCLSYTYKAQLGTAVVYLCACFRQVLVEALCLPAEHFRVSK